MSLFPCNGSDATLLPQLLAKTMGLPNTIPFYSQNGSIHGILGGVNFGSAEATILYPSRRSYQSLNQQLRQASEIIQLLQLHLGEEKANNFIKTSIFYLSFGKDDFIDYFVSNSSGIGRNFSHILVHQMTNAVRNLYLNNVRKIVCAGVLPLGCAPRMLLRSNDSCLDEVNMFVLEYNTMMEENVVAINAELGDAHVIFCDVYRAMIEVINHPTTYGTINFHRLSSPLLKFI
ncbi:GDSL esterase/lipase at5g37690 [Phtheirospermum japonicum]|uniref:GDSL esterase/lipase at5g37690 n=1 Tax=Phtheirospermum japonicum TaxID=374723 RepID=A0A830C711_9LAMI|nr:GDSL esterase/lipase at5g37690 [Phtheirospermum japonicum]